MRPKTYQKTVLTEAQKCLIEERYDSSSTAITDLSAQLGLSRQKIIAVAHSLGLMQERAFRHWTQTEDAYLEHHYCTTSMEAMVKHLKRSRGSIRQRVLALGLLKSSDGYTLQGLCIAFGCSDKRIHRWMNQGLLSGKRRNMPREHDLWYFSEKAVQDFVRTYREEISVVKPDINWLIALLSPDE